MVGGIDVERRRSCRRGSGGRLVVNLGCSSSCSFDVYQHSRALATSALLHLGSSTARHDYPRDESQRQIVCPVATRRDPGFPRAPRDGWEGAGNCLTSAGPIQPSHAKRVDLTIPSDQRALRGEGSKVVGASPRPRVPVTQRTPKPLSNASGIHRESDVCRTAVVSRTTLYWSSRFRLTRAQAPTFAQILLSHWKHIPQPSMRVT